MIQPQERIMTQAVTNKENIVVGAVGSVGAVEPQEMVLLTSEITLLRRENERLKTELPKIIQESMDEFRGKSIFFTLSIF